MDNAAQHAERPNGALVSKQAPEKPEPPIPLLPSLHWQHWLVVAVALIVTLYAWRYSAAQSREKAAIRFERATVEIVDLVRERMQRYEDALQAGAAFIDTIGGEIDYPTWRAYALRIGIKRKYPGIHGLGVIHHVRAENFGRYLAQQREARPDYEVHPPREAESYWPISYIVPIPGNEEAIGLDIAHEENRRAAAERARDQGEAQITGPIALVQDEQRTPGFLFYFPFYEPQARPPGVEARREAFLGLVYAPFVVRELMAGALARERRHVSFSIHDGDRLIYDENLAEAEGFDADPLFVAAETLDFYGREWRFDFRSSLGFRRDASSAQPATILIGGLAVDALLLALLAQVSRSSRRASRQAARLQRAQAELSRANDELSQFNYRTSHDLIAPLKTIRGFADLALRDLNKGQTDGAADLLRRIDAQAARLDQIVRDLLSLCQVDHMQEPAQPVDLEAILRGVDDSLRHLKQERGAEFRWSAQLREPLVAQPARVRQILENLVSNGLKYSDDSKAERWVEARAVDDAPGFVRIEVEDNGIGIPDAARGRVFDMFYRVGNNAQFGSGLGAYLVKKHVEAMGGSIGFTSSPSGSVFTVRIPRNANDSRA